MSQDNAVPKPTGTAGPDAAIKTTEKGGITLTEEDLDRASGGRLSCCTGQHIKKAILTV